MKETINLVDLSSWIGTLKRSIVADPSSIPFDEEFWKGKAEKSIAEIMKIKPSGQFYKFDLDIENSSESEIVINAEFFHYHKKKNNEETDEAVTTKHTIKITPTFGNFLIKVTGKNTSGVKECIREILYDFFVIAPILRHRAFAQINKELINSN